MPTRPEQEQPDELDQRRSKIQSGTDRWIGYNDRAMGDIHAEQPTDNNPGAPGTEDGFLFGGRVYTNLDPESGRPLIIKRNRPTGWQN